MKKCLTIILGLSLMLAAFSLPGTAEANAVPAIVCTTFSQYDWVREILGEQAADVQLTLLLDDGVDLHSYQPTAADIANLSSCDLFIYVGGESDGWIRDALQNATNPNQLTISMIDVLGDAVKEEETVEGMQAETGEAPASDPAEAETDEHVWLSLKNAEVICRAIADSLGELNPAAKETYAANADAYIAKLQALDARYQAAVDQSAHKTVLFADRFPFRYLMDDYHITYYAAFPGCSAESEASFATIAFLAGKIDELHLPAVLVIEGSDHTIAETIIANTADKNQPILALNSIQSVTQESLADGMTYLSAMEENLTVLEQALA